MNFTNETLQSSGTCFIAGQSFRVFDGRFPTELHPISHIFICMINVLLCITTTFLNTLTILTYFKSPRLKTSVPYFLIMVLSSVDLAVGLIGSVLLTSGTIIELRGGNTCSPLYYASQMATKLLVGLSIMTFFVMNIERYLGVVHPYEHRSKVTKGRLLVFLICTWFVWLITIGVHFVDNKLAGIIIFYYLVLLLGSTVYIYLKIAVAIRKSNRVFSTQTSSPGTGSSTQGLSVGQQTTRNKVFPTQTSSSGTGSSTQGLSAGQHTTRSALRQFVRDVKLAKSCFLVIICFFVCFLPSTVADALRLDSSISRAWIVTFVLVNSSLNSLIFFWRHGIVRNEARKIFQGQRTN